MARLEKHVLVVDDDDDYRTTITELVKEQHPFVTIAAAETAEEALDLVKKTPADLLIVDYRLPKQDGVAFVNQARALLPNAKFLMLSAEPDHYLLVKAGCTVLTKPVEPDVLKKMVRKLLVKQPAPKDKA